jgi:hypothetical protein
MLTQAQAKIDELTQFIGSLRFQIDRINHSCMLQPKDWVRPGTAEAATILAMYAHMQEMRIEDQLRRIHTVHDTLEEDTGRLITIMEDDLHILTDRKALDTIRAEIKEFNLLRNNYNGW